jgi:DNA-binding XRE family transcriptional regulator
MNAPLNIQTIKSITGKPEYVLIPIAVYNALREEIEEEIAGLESVAEKNGDYVPFALEDYVDNPVALARIKANVTQQQLARRMGVTQAYISKIEHQDKATPKLLAKIKAALAKRK